MTGWSALYHFERQRWLDDRQQRALDAAVPRAGVPAARNPLAARATAR